MRALQMTQNKGAPQGWVQDGMFLASTAVLAQLLVEAGVQLDKGLASLQPRYSRDIAASPA